MSPLSEAPEDHKGPFNSVKGIDLENIPVPGYVPAVKRIRSLEAQL